MLEAAFQPRSALSAWIEFAAGKPLPPIDFECRLMEVGWPTGGSGSESEQLAYIRRLPAFLEQVGVSVVAWALLHDINLAEFDADLNTVGLMTNSGRKKPGYREFKMLGNHLR
jgi:hypothetical protein